MAVPDLLTMLAAWGACQWAGGGILGPPSIGGPAMTKGQRTVAGLLAVIAVTLGPGLIVRDSPSAGAQPMGEACPEDCQAVPDGAVNVPDLLELLSQWGVCINCSCDFDNSNTVSVPDALQLLAAWGPCP